MQLFRSLQEIAKVARPSDRCVATIGSFDGIHLAHQDLLRRVRRLAESEGAVSTAITFEPHPLAVLAPERMPKLLTPLPKRLELFEQSGIDRLLLLPFTHELSLWTPERFVAEVLVQILHIEAIVVGDNFRFGHKQAGTPDLLRDLGSRWSFATMVVPGIRCRNLVVSSSQIRCLLEQGRITLANRLLGRPYSIRDAVQPGLGIGRSQTVPTLNLAPTGVQYPARGVYVTWARIGRAHRSGAVEFSTALPSVTNVGDRPTFPGRPLGIETHLLQHEPVQATASQVPVPPRAQADAGQPLSDPPYELEISFLYRLRDERKFDSPEQLKAQILRDVARAQTYFRRLRRFVPRAFPS